MASKYYAHFVADTADVSRPGEFSGVVELAVPLHRIVRPGSCAARSPATTTWTRTTSASCTGRCSTDLFQLTEGHWSPHSGSHFGDPGTPGPGTAYVPGPFFAPVTRPCDTPFPRDVPALESTPMRGFTIVLLGLSALLSGCGYNTLQTQDEQVTASWSEVVNQYQRRSDLIPNLVATVKGFAAQEERVLVGVTEARARATGRSSSRRSC
jgi:hypothetical protein